MDPMQRGLLECVYRALENGIIVSSDFQNQFLTANSWHAYGDRRWIRAVNSQLGLT